MLEHKGTKTIKTPRLTLRRFELEDAQAMYDNWAGDEEVVRFLTWPAHGCAEISRLVLEDWVEGYEKDDFYQWAIVPDELGQPIGSISGVKIDEKTCCARIGYCIGRQWWHKGITSEALAAVMDFLFLEVGALRVEAFHATENPHSGGVMRKCGMVHEGRLRRGGWCNRGIVDIECYGILREEWEG